jgi:hypothetical protein
MTLSTPPPYNPPPVPEHPGDYSHPLGGTYEVNYENNELDNSSQNNINESRNTNVQINAAFQRAEAESLGNGIRLNNPLSVYGQVTSDGDYTQGTIGFQWTPGRGKTARKILKQRQQQIALSIQQQQQAYANEQFKAQLALEQHCAKLANGGFTSPSCKGIVARIPAAKPKAQQPPVVTEEGKVDCAKTGCTPVPARW